MQLTFDLSVWQVLQLFVIPVFLPVLVGLVTKFTTSASLKSILLLGLSVLTALLTELVTAVNAGEVYNLGMGLLMALITFVTGVAIHFGLWRPTGVTDRVQAVGDPTHNYGEVVHGHGH